MNFVDRVIGLERVKGADLLANPANYRTHPDLQRDALRGVLEDIGFAGALLAYRDNGALVLIDGHLRLEEGGPETVFPVLVTDLTPEEARKQLLVNDPLAMMATLDSERLQALVAQYEADVQNGAVSPLAGLETILAVLGQYPLPEPPTGPVAPPSDVLPPSAPARCQPGDLWRLGKHRLLVGDSLNSKHMAQLLGGEQVDCVFTSPPYGVGVDYGAYADTLANLRKLIPKAAALWRQVVVSGGYAVVNFSDLVSGQEAAGTETACEYPMALEYWEPFRKQGWDLWSRRIWAKRTAAVSSLHCIQSNRAAKDWEHLWTWKKAGPAIIEQQITGEFASQIGVFDTHHEALLDIGKETHGAGMPVAVAVRMLSTHARPGRAVLEPFCGTGTTLMAAEHLGHPCFACELHPPFADLTLARWEAHTGETAEKVAWNGGEE